MVYIMLIEIWEHLRGYDKWIQTEATIQSSDLAEVDLSDIRYSRFGRWPVHQIRRVTLNHEKLCPVYDSFSFCQARLFNSRARSSSGGRDGA